MMRKLGAFCSSRVIYSQIYRNSLARSATVMNLQQMNYTTLHNIQERKHWRNCEFEGCINGAISGYFFCSRHGGGRRCLKPDCVKGARPSSSFCILHGGGMRCQEKGCKNGAEHPSSFCIRHGGGKRCHISQCNKGAKWPSHFCIAHGGGKRCHMVDCKKSAQRPSDFCVRHGGGKLCNSPECAKAARGSSGYCFEHGGGKRCQILNCNKAARSPTEYCSTHGGGMRCQEMGCKSGARDSSGFCSFHGGGKRCQEPNCSKGAQGKSEFCSAHGGGERCKECYNVSITKKSRTYPFCHHCFMDKFPNKPLVRKYRVKQKAIEKRLEQRFHFISDQRVSGGISNMRPDFLFEVVHNSSRAFLILEIDENQHKQHPHEVESERIKKIHADLNFMPVKVIRFNPDHYLDDTLTKITGCFDSKCKIREDEFERRLVVLIKEIEASFGYFEENYSEVLLFFDRQDID